jgi:hypothetical protein
MKREVYREYGVTSHESGDYEGDHLIPLELGGSNSIKNLWPESHRTSPWNAQIKLKRRGARWHVSTERRAFCRLKVVPLRRLAQDRDRAPSGVGADWFRRLALASATPHGKQLKFSTPE